MGELVELDARRTGRIRRVPTTEEHWDLLLMWRELGEEMSEEELRAAFDALQAHPALQAYFLRP